MPTFSPSFWTPRTGRGLPGACALRVSSRLGTSNTTGVRETSGARIGCRRWRWRPRRTHDAPSFVLATDRPRT
jgi:hypothetical protein